MHDLLHLTWHFMKSDFLEYSNHKGQALGVVVVAKLHLYQSSIQTGTIYLARSNLQIFKLIFPLSFILHAPSYTREFVAPLLLWAEDLTAHIHKSVYSSPANRTETNNSKQGTCDCAAKANPGWL